MFIKEIMKFSRDTFSALDKHWRGNNEGIWRPAYSTEEAEAIDIIGAEAKRLGMSSYCDPAGNAYFIYPGKKRNSPVFMTGSHMDAVPNGGRWDGAAGVVAGLAAIKLLHTNDVTPEQDVVLVVFRGEESAWFNQALLGSGFASGRLDQKHLDSKRNDTGKTLASHMSDIGINVDVLRDYLDKKTPFLPANHIGVFLETHIEQSYILQKENKDLGIVTGIRGNARCPEMISFYGEAAHTGATLQADRKDASLAAAYYQVALDQKFKEIEKTSDIVWAITEGSVVDGSPTTVSKQYNIRPEVRSLDLSVLTSVKNIFHDCAQKIARERSVIVDTRSEHIIVSEPVILGSVIQNSIYEASVSLGYDIKLLPSGAGHDAANIAKAGIETGMIFLPHGNNGISHNPKEIMAATEKEDPFSVDGAFCKAVHVMSKIMASYDTGISLNNHCFEDYMDEINTADIEYRYIMD